MTATKTTYNKMLHLNKHLSYKRNKEKLFTVTLKSIILRSILKEDEKHTSKVKYYF